MNRPRQATVTRRTFRGSSAKPALRLLSLGAGVQSSTVLLLACDGVIPPFDHAVFADTGWEPAIVYRQLERLRDHAVRHGIAVSTVSAGNIRADALDPQHRFASMPLHVRNPDGSKGLARRQCTAEYKVRPLKAKARELLGYPHPRPVPADLYAEQAIGISVDEVHRAKDADVRYLRNTFPLLDLRWTRADCLTYLKDRGWGSVAKSACLGCPFHSDAAWRRLRDHDPDGWADAVTFDRAIRHGYPRATRHGQPLRGRYYLHRSCRPLDQVDLDTGRSDTDGPQGCSPWSCRSDEPATTGEVAA